MTIAAAPAGARDCDSFLDDMRSLLPAANRLAYAMLQDPSEAEDAVQEATLKAWRARHRLREGSVLRPWFLTIVANQCRQQRRNRWWSVVKWGDVPERPAAESLGTAEATDLRRAVARLPFRPRLALVLRYYLDLPLDEVGEALGISTGAAKSLVHRALVALRAHLSGGVEE